MSPNNDYPGQNQQGNPMPPQQGNPVPPRQWNPVPPQQGNPVPPRQWNPAPQQQWNPAQQQWGPIPPQKPKDNGGFAIASFVIGLVGLLLNFCCIPYITPILGILSLVFGIVSIRSSKKGMAVAGIILGAFTILFAIFIMVGVFAAFGYDGDMERFLEDLLYDIFGTSIYY